MRVRSERYLFSKKMNADQILRLLAGRRVAVVGDVMIDRYVYGSVTRISPEAPVPVVASTHIENRPGGAANVALNLYALGAVPLVYSVVGAGPEADVFADCLPQPIRQEACLIRSANRRTTVKTRVVGNRQQMLRIDEEDVFDLDAGEAEALLHAFRRLCENEPPEALILQDYNKGVLSAQVIAELMSIAQRKGVFVAVDPKKDNFWAYEGADLFKPNLKEVREGTGLPVGASLAELSEAHFFAKRLKNRHTMITLSEKGVYLCTENGTGQIYPTQERVIADVSGAGDTVISVTALAFAAGLDQDTIGLLANLAGGQVCERPGVVPVSADKLRAELQKFAKK